MLRHQHRHPAPPIRKRKWILQIDYHDSIYYWRQHWYGTLTCLTDDEQQLPVIQSLSKQDACRLNENDAKDNTILNIYHGIPYKAGNLSERFLRKDDITSCLNRQIMCNNLPIDEVYIISDCDTILVWSRKD